MKKTKAQRSTEATMAAARKLTRRSVVKGAAAAAALGPLIVRGALASSGELKIMTWSDYIPQTFHDGFRKKTGITIKHTPYGSNEELLNKIRATRGRGFDIIGPTVDRAPQWKPLDLLQPWDMNRVPTDAILPGMLKSSTDNWTWDGKNYHLPYTWGSEALAWRTDKWSREYNNLSYGNLWLPEMEGKIMGRAQSMMAGIGLYLDGTGVLPSNRMLDAYKDEDNMRRIWDEITEFAVEHKSWLKQFWNDADGQINGFLHNDVVLGQTWDGPPTRLKNEGQPVTYMAPQEGAFAWLDGQAMPKGAKNIDEIYEYLEYTFSPDIGGMLANETGYNPVVKGATHHMSEKMKTDFRDAYPGDALDRLWWWPPTEPWYAEIRNEYVDKFVAA